MKQRILGHSGYRVSEIGLGCWQLGGGFGPVADDRAEAILDTAQRQDIDFWDTADVYGAGLSENRIGRWRRENPQAEPTIATKVGRSPELYPDHYDLERIRASLEGSRKRLGVETIDLAQLHCVPFECLQSGKIFEHLETLRSEGLIRHYGASVEAMEEGLFCIEHSRVTSLQIIFNIFRPDAIEKLFDRAEQAEVGIIVRLPLASGLLAGKWTSATLFDDSDHRSYNRDGAAFHVGETFSGIPFAKGVELTDALATEAAWEGSLSQLALRWVLDHSAVSTVIAGASRPDQVVENARASALAPLPASLHSFLADFFETRVDPHVRGPR